MTIYLTPPSGGGAANVSSGTTGSEGTVRLATTAEAQDVNNETLAVTPKALNAQINSAVVGGIQYKGSIDAANIPTALLNANQGDFYKISVANASVAGTDWDIGDNLIVNTDMGGTFDAAKIDKIDSTDADLATVAVTGSYNDLSNTPNLATVATSGSYNDLTNKPTIPTNSTDLGDTTDLIRTTDVASDTVQGIVELATNGETAIGTDSARAVTPAGLTHKLGDYTPTSGLPSFGTAATANATDFLSAIGSASLGGNLDVDGKDIISSSDGDIEIAPNGTGSLIVKGNTAASAINTGHLQLNCENNSHSVTIAAPTHSAINTGGSYTLTLPGSIGNPSDVLSTDSNGNLSWVAQSGGGGGGGSLPVVTEQTATITLSNPASGVTEEIHTVSSSSAVTITLALSATVTEGFKYQIKRLGTGGVTIQCGGSEFIDHSGQTSLTIDFQYDSITLVANGTSPTASWLLI